VYEYPHPSGDEALYDNNANILYACDSSQNGTTARAILVVINGNTKTVFDSNGNQPGCGQVGPLNVDDTKTGYLIICASGSDSTCRPPSETFPV
jgi:hypothetical protein